MCLVVCKYVDDFYGIQKEGSRTKATDWMAICFDAFGLPLDSRKSEAFMTALNILGARVTISWMRQGVRLALSEDKLKRWGAGWCTLRYLG